MAVLNIQAARAWLGALLMRRGPISPTTWRGMVDQGMPVGSIGGSPFISTEAVEAWLESRAGLPLDTAPMPTRGARVMATGPRRPGRPRKSLG